MVESSTHKGAFGYWGDPTTEDVPAVVWPDVEAPSIVSATATSATELDVVFDENVAFFGAGSFVAGSVVADVEDVFVLATAGVIATTTLTLTFPASTFTAGDVIKLFIANNALEDTASPANVFQGISDVLVTNSVP